MEQQAKIPPDILEQLRNYPNHCQGSCLNCGYRGAIAIKPAIIPWYLSFWMLMLLAALLSPFISMWGGVGVAVIFFIIRQSVVKTLYFCPSCKTDTNIIQ